MSPADRKWELGRAWRRQRRYCKYAKAQDQRQVPRGERRRWKSQSRMRKGRAGAKANVSATKQLEEKVPSPRIAELKKSDDDGFVVLKCRRYVTCGDRRLLFAAKAVKLLLDVGARISRNRKLRKPGGRSSSFTHVPLSAPGSPPRGGYRECAHATRWSSRQTAAEDHLPCSRDGAPFSAKR